MKKILLTLTVLLALTIPGLSVSAQSLEDAEGLETAYGRNYSSGSSNTVSAPSSSSTPKDMESEATYTGLEIIGLTFDSDENAEKSLAEMKESIQNSLDSDDSPEDAEYKELSDLDIDKNGFFVIGSVENTGVNATILFVDGNHMFLIDVLDPDFDTAKTLVTDIAKFMDDADIENDDVSFNENGTSTGGVYDLLPKAGDKIVGDRAPADYKLLPAE